MFGLRKHFQTCCMDVQLFVVLLMQCLCSLTGFIHGGLPFNLSYWKNTLHWTNTVNIEIIRSARRLINQNTIDRPTDLCWLEMNPATADTTERADKQTDRCDVASISSVMRRSTLTPLIKTENNAMSQNYSH